MRKWVTIASIFAVALGACGRGDDDTAPPSSSPTENSTAATTDASTTTDAPAITAPPEAANALGVVDALTAAGLPIGTTIEFIDVTDPDERLGRPGQYIAKAAWIDTRVDCVLDEPGWECGGDVELFDNPDDLDSRWNDLIAFADTPPIGGYYMWRSDTAIVRLGFAIAPSLAYEYQIALGATLGGVEALEKLTSSAGTAAPTTTATPTTTTTTTTTSTPPDTDTDTSRMVATVVFEMEMRDDLIDALGRHPEVETVDRVELDSNTDTLILAVTSPWATSDKQVDGAWTLMRQMALWWEDGEAGVMRRPNWSASFQMANGSVSFFCSAEFMQRLSDSRASRSDWLAECST
jgi:hypothetical protein